MNKNSLEKNSTAQFLIFNAENTEFHIEVRVEDETIWLTQKLMAELFSVDTRTISEHLQNIFKTNELKEDSTIRNFRIVQIEGSREVSRDIEHYNLDAIIAVGYRVNSKKATQFRIWATHVLSLKDLLWMMSGSNKERSFSPKIILKNFLSECGLFVPVNEEFINKSLTFLQSVVLTMIQIQMKVMNFTQWFKINSILLLQAKLHQK